MEFALPRPSGALQLLSAVSREAWHGLRAPATPSAIAASRHGLLSVLDDVAEVAERLADSIATSGSGQPGANAASVCRWELGRLRDRAKRVDVAGKDRSHRAAIVRHLDEGITAAQILSAGFRFHSLDRICRGGADLDDRLAELARLRVKLVAGS